jgi:hypothetical protein
MFSRLRSLLGSIVLPPKSHLVSELNPRSTRRVRQRRFVVNELVPPQAKTLH